MRRRTRDDMDMGETDLAALRWIIRQERAGTPPTSAGLARALGVSTAATVKVVGRLVKGGYIERSRHPSDRRALLLGTLPGAHERLRAALGPMHETDARARVVARSGRTRGGRGVPRPPRRDRRGGAERRGRPVVGAAEPRAPCWTHEGRAGMHGSRGPTGRGTGDASAPPGCSSSARRFEVLLQHRAEWSHFGGTWGIPGGARHEGESAVDAAVREAGEEAGVPVGALTRAVHLCARPRLLVVHDRRLRRVRAIRARGQRPREHRAALGGRRRGRRAAAASAIRRVVARPARPALSACRPRTGSPVQAGPAAVVRPCARRRPRGRAGTTARSPTCGPGRRRSRGTSSGRSTR